MLFSVTASHYDCNIKGKILDYTIESLLKNSIEQCLISISFDDEAHYIKNKESVDFLIKKYDNKVKIYIQHKRFFQFQHLEFLCNEMKNFSNLDDKILFCDDDDILLNLPQIDNYEVISGIQYLSNLNEVELTGYYDNNQILELLKSEESKLQIVDDFSGYVCSYKIFEDFFKINKFNFTGNLSKLEIMKFQLIDTTFMDYLDNLNSHKLEKPFVYHRIWKTHDRQKQMWLNTIIECCDELKYIESEINYKIYLKKSLLVIIGILGVYLIANKIL